MLKTILFAVTFCAMVAIAGAQSPTPSPSPAPSPAETPQAALAPPASETPRRFRVEQGVATGNIIHKVNPEYPREARAKHIQGEVVMKMTINVKGDVENLHVVQGDPLLAEAALNAVKQWKYKPFLLNGQAVPIDTVVKINFHL